VAQLGSAHGWGPWGRRFKSCHPDQFLFFSAKVILKMKQTLLVRAIVKQNEAVLLLRRAVGNPQYVGLYELPGGNVGFGEDPRAALQNLVAKTIGREIEALQLEDVYSELDVRDLQHQYIELVFLVTLKPGTGIELSAEHDKYEWKKLSDIQLNEVTETTRLALQLETRSVVSTGNEDIIDNLTTINEDVIIYADGGSRGNPGPSASGFVIKDPTEKVLFRGGEYVGVTTNNQAEYQAVKFALEKALELGAKNAKVRLDSLLVVNQLNGIYKIKNKDLWPIYIFIKELITKFKTVTVSHVRREFNKEADAMVNRVLDEREA
jgi:ribonuclease HI